MNSYILLEDIIFYAYHGVFEQERKVGNTFVLNIKVEVDLRKSGETDDLDDTVSYADIYELIKQEMSIPSKLLEHVAARILKRLRSDFPEIGSIELKLSKRNPPLGGEVAFASVVLID